MSDLNARIRQLERAVAEKDMTIQMLITIFIVS